MDGNDSEGDRMKLLFYISTIRSGGAARVMSNLANYMSTGGHEVMLVTNFSSETDYPLTAGVLYRQLEGGHESKSNFVIKNYHRIRALRRTVLDFEPDLVISFMHENDVRAFFAVKGCKTKLLLSVRNDPAELYGKKYLKKAIARYVYGRADGVVFQTKAAADFFTKKKGKGKVILNPVAKEFFQEKRNQDCVNDIITVGKFLPQKNHLMLIEAFAEISDKISDNLVIYGEGKLKEKYLERISELHLEGRVKLPGRTDRVAEVLGKAKLFVLSSDFEGMPNALMEAIAVGVPVLSTDCPCGGPQDLLESCKDVSLVQVGNREMMAKKMLRILTDESLQDFLNVNNQRIAARFFPETIYSEWKVFFEELIN